MQTITRLHGTKCHTATTADEFTAACKNVLDHGYAKVNDMLVDATTAGMVVNVWKALNDKNRDITRNFWNNQLTKGGGRFAVARIVKLFWKCVQ